MKRVLLIVGLIVAAFACLYVSVVFADLSYFDRAVGLMLFMGNITLAVYHCFEYARSKHD